MPKMWKGWSSDKCVVGQLEHRSPRRRVAAKKGKGGGKGPNAAKTCWHCGESGHVSSQCPQKKVHAVEESTTASQAGSQETSMVGPIGSYFDLGSVSEGTLEFRGAGEEICSVGIPSVIILDVQSVYTPEQIQY